MEQSLELTPYKPTNYDLVIKSLYLTSVLDKQFYVVPRKLCLPGIGVSLPGLDVLETHGEGFLQPPTEGERGRREILLGVCSSIASMSLPLPGSLSTGLNSLGSL